MQQREPRLGDILDDYCPRERRVTNHAVVAMVGPDVKQTRCTTCDTEHQYKHAKVPRQRRKSDTPAALYAQVASGGPKRVAHDPAPDSETDGSAALDAATGAATAPTSSETPAPGGADDDAAQADLAADLETDTAVEEGPVHRPLIRATLPRVDGQPPPPRPAPEFTIRQPTGRHGRFHPRHQRGPSPFQGNRSGNTAGGGMSRPGGGRPPMMHSGRRHGPGHKRSK